MRPQATPRCQCSVPRCQRRGTLLAESFGLPHARADAMKPYIVCHMMSSVDGRSLTDGWHLDFASDLYEDTAGTFEADGWICGRVTMQEISHGTDYPKGLAKGAVPRTDHFVERKADQYAISIDPQGRVAWKTHTP